MSLFLKWAKKANDALLGIETVCMAVISFALVMAIFIEVICRYFLFISMPWAEELTRYLFIWLTYIGSAYAVYYGQHTEIDILQQVLLKSRSQKKEIELKSLRLAAIVSTFLFLVVFGKVFFDYMMAIWAKTQTSPTMHIPMGYIYLPVFIGTVMAALHEIYMFLCEVTRTEEDVPTKPEAE
ncbi:MAG: TRAP transporter small permease [Clostridiales bacterium]|nr:TRAP transporter small permease [Clostridiales bacterium]